MSAYALIDRSTGTFDHQRQKTIDRAKKELEFFVIPHLSFTALSFDYNATTKKVDFNIRGSLADYPIEYLVEEPQPGRMIKLTAKARRSKKQLKQLAVTNIARFRLKLRDEKIIDDPNILTKRIFRLAYIQAIEYFANKTYGNDLPRHLRGYLLISDIESYDDEELEVQLSIGIHVAFEK